jgi:hypothetical protein
VPVLVLVEEVRAELLEMLTRDEELVVRVLELDDTVVLTKVLVEAEAERVDLPVVLGVVIADVGVTSVALAVEEVGRAIGSSRSPGRGTARVGVSNGAGRSI